MIGALLHTCNLPRSLGGKGLNSLEYVQHFFSKHDSSVPDLVLCLIERTVVFTILYSLNFLPISQFCPGEQKCFLVFTNTKRDLFLVAWKHFSKKVGG